MSLMNEVLLNYIKNAYIQMSLSVRLYFQVYMFVSCFNYIFSVILLIIIIIILLLYDNKYYIML